MKWLLIIVLVFVIMIIAYSLSEQYKDKYDFYLNLKNFLNQFKINLSFKQDKIINFLNNLRPKKQFKLFINSYINYLSSDKLDLSEIKILDDEEKLELENLINDIGKYDVTNEINQIENFLYSIDQKLKKAEDDKTKLCPMIIKLSLLFAIGLAILLI